MPLQWRNPIWQSLEEGAGRKKRSSFSIPTDLNNSLSYTSHKGTKGRRGHASSLSLSLSKTTHTQTHTLQQCASPVPITHTHTHTHTHKKRHNMPSSVKTYLNNSLPPYPSHTYTQKKRPRSLKTYLSNSLSCLSDTNINKQNITKLKKRPSFSEPTSKNHFP